MRAAELGSMPAVNEAYTETQASQLTLPQGLGMWAKASIPAQARAVTGALLEQSSCTLLMQLQQQYSQRPAATTPR